MGKTMIVNGEKHSRKKRKIATEDDSHTSVGGPVQSTPAADVAVASVAIDKDAMEMVQSSKAEMLQLLQEYTAAVKAVQSDVQPLIDSVQEGEYAMNKGLSYLAVKNQILIGYCANVAYVMLLKAAGRSLQGHPVIQELIEDRVFIEKVRPLDQKLKYQIDKMVKTAASGEASNREDQLRYKANPESMAQVASDSDVDQDNPALYVPPRLAAVRMETDTVDDKRRKVEAKLARDLREHELYSDLVAQYTETPLEVKDTETFFGGSSQGRLEREERRRYEEENMVRLMENKKTRHAKKRQRLRNELDDITDFGRIAKLEKARSRARPATGNPGLEKKKLLKQYQASGNGPQQHKGDAKGRRPANRRPARK